MSINTLNWADFNWSQFQLLCIRIAESSFPDCNFDEYLNHGHKQDGIDLISLHKKDGKFLMVQCKRVQKMDIADIDKVISDLLKGEYKEKTSCFILATSADLQFKELQLGINNRKQSLYADYGIEFQCWDQKIVEGRLKNLWSVVSYFFGKRQADDFCYQQPRHTFFVNLKEIEYYIPRTISDNIKEFSENGIGRKYSTKKKYTLKQMFLENRLLTRRICIIGDAYEGKSTYIRQSAFELKEAGDRFQPLLIEIKEFNVQSLETLLSKRFGAWEDIGFKDLIIFIDGLDEVSTDKFTELVKYINEFSSSFRSISIVLSCRRLFFDLYEVDKIIPEFQFFDLDGLSTELVDFYLRNRLDNLFDDFKEAAYRNDLMMLLYRPFYLVNLATDFLMPPHKLPGSKIAILNSFVNKAFKASSARQLKDSDKIKMNGILFKQTIERFAFALQLGGLNAFNFDQIQEIFTRQEQILLQHNSLVYVAGETWSFNNSLFQEHLAASLLIQLKFDQIISYCAIGRVNPKVKTKWIQTISSALSLLDVNNILFQQILQFIEQDNIELIFQTERSKHTDEFKFLTLQKLIVKCEAQNSRLMLVPEEAIGVFIENVPVCVDYLLNFLADNKITNVVKTTCVRIVANTSVTDDQKIRYTYIALEEIANASDGHYAGYIVEALTALKIGDSSLIQKLVDMKHLANQHPYRDKVYALIRTLGLIDKFYFYGLEGMLILKTYNERISHGGSGRELQEFLVGTSNRYLISILLQKDILHKELTYLEFTGLRDSFLVFLFKKLAVLFRQDPLIIIPIARFIKEVSKRFLRDNAKEIDNFLETTNTHWLVIRLLIDDIMKDYNWEFGGLISEMCYDYVLWEYEQGNYGIQSLRSCLGGIRINQKNEEYDTFYKLSLAITGGEIENKEVAEQTLIYRKAELQKQKNDLVYIRSVKDFAKGLRKYFKDYGKKSISEDNLYIESDRSSVRQQSDSRFLFAYLALWAPRNGKVIQQNEALEFIKNQENFEIFRAEEIMNYSFPDEDSKKELSQLLERYYLTELPKANFKNCHWIENDVYHFCRLELRLGEIYRKFQFSTSEQYLLEFIWLDQGGTRIFYDSVTKKRDTIIDLVLKNLDNNGIIKLKKKVVENMRIGIKLEAVLGAHIALCKKLIIHEAKDLIVAAIEQAGSESTLKIDATDIYLELGGDLNIIAKIFLQLSDYNDYYFLYLAKILSIKKTSIVVDVVGIALKDLNTSLERRVQLAELLAEIGYMSGFSYMVNEVRTRKVFSENIFRGHNISRVNTKEALRELQDIAYLVVDDKYYDKRRFYETGRYIILDWLNQLAAKSEDDLIEVTGFLEKSKIQLTAEFPDAIDLNYYINRMFENFRSSDKTTRSISEIKIILKQIENG